MEKDAKQWPAELVAKWIAEAKQPLPARRLPPFVRTNPASQP